MESLFAKLPFLEAINALLDRLALPKDVFMALDAAARSRAFTMARVADQNILEQIHDELVIAINNGETFADFKKRLADVRERSGWTGTSNWHYRLVYDQNLGMAYSAGRYQQGRDSGLRVVRILASLADEPRPEHAIFADQLFRFEPGSMLPPWDFGCQCGWEWVFSEELEAMGKRPEDFPVLPFTGAGQQFQWSPVDYLSASMRKPQMDGDQRKAGHGLRRLICEIGEMVPDRLLLVPWGHVESRTGPFFVNEQAGQDMLAAFVAHGVDLPIDYQHATLGGEWSTPDGTAPAAGWIKELEIVPNEGVYGRVEWTDRARSMIARKEYRYLSPVVLYKIDTLQAVQLHSVGLTNVPAIPGMQAIVNQTDLNLNMEVKPMESEGLIAELKTLLQLGDEATMEDLLAAIKSLAEKVRTFEITPEEGAAVIEAIAEVAEQELAGEGGEEVAEAVREGETEAVASSLRKVIMRLKNPIGVVKAEELANATRRIAALEAKIAEGELEALLQANSSKLPPAEQEGFRELFRKDPTFAQKWLDARPAAVNTQAGRSGQAAAGSPDRMMLVNSAKVDFTSKPNLALFTSARAYVNDALHRAGHKVLSPEEADKLGIAA